MRKAFIILQYPRVFLADILYKRAHKIQCRESTAGKIIDQDMIRYRSKKSSAEGVSLLNDLLLSNKIFRTQFYFRIGHCKEFEGSILFTALRSILPPLENLEIGVNRTGYIGGGLMIMHKAGCVLSIHEAGKNLTVFQGVTIGDSNRIHPDGYKNPVIGNNVTIFANSVIGGGISIGDNVTIGAGSVLLSNVPANCVVAGNPARIIRKDGIKVNMTLYLEIR